MADLVQQSETVDLRHLEIGEDDAERLGEETLERPLAIARDLGVVAFVAKNGAQSFGDGAFVVGDQDLGGHGFESTPARASAGNRR